MLEAYLPRGPCPAETAAGENSTPARAYASAAGQHAAGSAASLAGELAHVLGSELRAREAALLDAESAFRGLRGTAAHGESAVDAGGRELDGRSGNGFVPARQSVDDLRLRLREEAAQLHALQAREAEGQGLIPTREAEVEQRLHAAGHEELLALRLRDEVHASREQALERRKREDDEAYELRELGTVAASRAAELSELKLRLCMLEAGAASRAERHAVTRDEWCRRLRELSAGGVASHGSPGGDDQERADDWLSHAERCEKQLRNSEHLLAGNEEELACQEQRLVGWELRVEEERRSVSELRTRAEAEAANIARLASFQDEEHARAQTEVSTLEAELQAGAQALQRLRAAAEAAASLQSAMSQAVSGALALKDDSRHAELRGHVFRQGEALEHLEARTAAIRGDIAASRAEASELRARLDRREERLRHLERERHQWTTQQESVRACEARLAALAELCSAPDTDARPGGCQGGGNGAGVAASLVLSDTLHILGYEDSTRLLPGMCGDTELLLRASALDAASRAVLGELGDLFAARTHGGANSVLDSRGGPRKPSEKPALAQLQDISCAYGLVAPPPISSK
mmetsp:Transcript_37985/g.104436  ORF Transcript_37985/g.104436 Transcript_37985/m.104436 type:complete len:580 (-) Transcript_37985:128-1867(-)